MRLTLQTVSTRDGLELPGLLYEPRRKTRKAVIFLHGNGDSSVFYPVERTNGFAKALTRAGWAFFPFNNRGAHYVKRLPVKRGHRVGHMEFGTAYEVIRDCVHDIDAAIAFLRRRGYREFYLAGHSTGANKICVYDYLKRGRSNSVRGYIMLAPGDDVGIYYQALGRKTFFTLHKTAKKMMRKKSWRRKLVPHKLLGYPMSWQSLYDTINPDGDYNCFPFLEALGHAKLSRQPLFRYLRAIRKPALAILGEYDEYCYGKVSKIVEKVRGLCVRQPNMQWRILYGADHGFHKKEPALMRAVTQWLKTR